MWKHSPPAPAASGEAVDPTEAQGLVADVELGEAGQAGADDDVALGARLEGAAPSEVEDASEHGGRRPAWPRARVGPVEEAPARPVLGACHLPPPIHPGCD